MPAATAEKEPKVKNPKQPTQEISQIEQMNGALAEAWEQMGLFKTLLIQKATILNIANLEGMPLSGIDIIKTQQGPRLYINSEGAKYNRDKYLNSQGRELSGRVVEMMDQMPGSNLEQDKAQGRKYFKTTTKVKSAEYEKIIDGIASGKVNAETGLKILEKIVESNTYTSFSAFSYQSESFAQNRTPEHIIKKGQTQAHRRADLEISKQCVLPADEDPIDAEFQVKSIDVLKEAQASAGGGAPALAPTAPGKIVSPMPEAPAPAPAPAPKAETKAPGPGGEGTVATKQEDPEAIKAKIAELRTVFDQAGLSKFEQQKWMTDNQFPIKPKEMTVAVLGKAITAAHKQFDKKPAAADAPAAAAPAAPAAAVAPAKEDPVKNEVLASIFGHREKAGFDTDDALRDWVKKTRQKGLSEMTVQEATLVDTNVRSLSGILTKYQKWGMASPAQVKEYANDSQGKSLYDMSLDEIKKFEADLDEMM